MIWTSGPVLATRVGASATTPPSEGASAGTPPSKGASATTPPPSDGASATAPPSEAEAYRPMLHPTECSGWYLHQPHPQLGILPQFTTQGELN